jgi:hypothetical protein
MIEDENRSLARYARYRPLQELVGYYIADYDDAPFRKSRPDRFDQFRHAGKRKRARSGCPSP